MRHSRPLVIYVDVDDSLVRSYGSRQIPITGVIERLRLLCAEEGVVAYCWSSGGAEYARGVAERLGIAALFVAFLPKPNLMIDDQPPSAWPDVRVLHPNEAMSTDAAAARLKLGWAPDDG